jgi:hypothetical protein
VQYSFPDPPRRLAAERIPLRESVFLGFGHCIPDDAVWAGADHPAIERAWN